ncbi:hypothetical protein [Clostridium sp.]|uniref:hypothetical protein n=1 Tax=Clostridium sp. TaxID=1506 RepID=UPI001A5425A2|nr:hypothetical protein [Clostridium sp.]MBK5239825.1 hypothetical protein [Clostridium sp.]
MESLIFKPSDKKLIEAGNRRNSRLAKLKNSYYTQQQVNERNNVELEVFQYMTLLQDRVKECICL